MADHHQIVAEIRAVLQSGDPARNGRLVGLASAYAEACIEVTQRLGRCHRLLQQGLRSEAIQLAETEPKLLNMVAALDFPERSEWDDLVQMNQLTPAPKLPIEPARLLDEAYAEEDPLQDLLRRHRRLALQRAPLRSRIGVLRQLAAQDPGNPIWADDVRAFEGVRSLQIQDEATEAVRHHDADAIAGLVAEVEQPGWAEPPPQALVQSLRKADAQLQGEHARATIEDVESRLNDAFNSRDPIRGRLVRQEWIKLSTAAALPPDDPIAERVRSALDWLDDEDRRAQGGRQYETALAKLVRVLDYPGFLPAAVLEHHAHRVLSYGHGMPPEVQQRYISRLRATEAAQTRRFRTNAAAIAAVLFLAGSLVYAVIHSQTRANDAEQSATSISDLLELGELDRAVGLLKKLEAADPELLTYPRLVEVRARVDLAQNQEADRAVRFDKAMREAERTPVAAKPPPAMETARSLARLETEKAALAHLTERRAAALQAERTKREKQLDPRLDEIGRAVDRIEQQVESVQPGTADAAAILGPLAGAQSSLADIRPELDLADETLQSRSHNLEQRLEAVRSRLDRRQLQTRLEDAITAAVGDSPTARGFTNPAEFATGLQTYAKTFPELPRSRAFIATLREQPLWSAVADWDRLTAGWRGDRTAIPPQEAKVRAEQCRQFLVQHPGSPDVDRVNAYQRSMEAIARRGADADGTVFKLQRLLSDLLVDNLWMITAKPPTAGGTRRYYLTQKPAPDARSIRYLIGFDGKERSAKIVADWIERTDVAPQTKLVAKFKPIFFQDPARIDWEAGMVDLLDRIRTQPEMDPVLQMALLRKVLELAVEGSEPLRETLGGFKNLVDQADMDVTVPWMDPENKEADRVRAKAAGVVRSLPDLALARKEALDRRARTERQVARRPRTIGWLAREADGWQVRTGSALPARGVLWIVMPGDASRGKWQQVGTIDQAKPRLSLVDDPALAEARPVFLTSPEADES